MDVYKEWLGIPEGNRPPNHYELLRLVQFEDDPEKVRAHYKKLNGHVRKFSTGQYMVQSQDLMNEMAKAMLCLTDPERKREYDEGLGREFEDDGDELGRKPLLRVLTDRGMISRDQAKEVEEYAEARGLTNRDAVVQMKLADIDAAAQALSVELGLPFVDLSDMVPDDDVLDMVPRNIVKRHSALPLFIDDDVLLVACASEPEHELEEDIRMRFGLPMRGVLATPLAVNQGIAKYYAPGAREEASEASSKASDAKSAKGGKKKPAKSKAKKKSAGDDRTFAQLTDQEKSQRKQMGILFICWSLIGAALLFEFVLTANGLGWLISLLVLLPIPLGVIFYVTKVYWK